MPGGQGRGQQDQPTHGFPFQVAGFPSTMRSPFDDPFFTRDPFDDPFFTQPFGRTPFGGPPGVGFFGGGLFGGGLLGGGLLGGGLLGGGSLFGSAFHRDPFFAAPFPQLERPVSQQPQSQSHTQQRQLPPAPHVQEIDPSTDPTNWEGAGYREPIVEDPSDEEDEADEHPRREGHRGNGVSRHAQSSSNRNQHPLQQQNSGQNHTTVVTGAHPFPHRGSSSEGGRGTATPSFSYQSSYVSYSGIGGTQYFTASSSRTVGPGGVVEEQRSHRDSSGTEGLTVSRSINEKGRTLTRTRRGREENSQEVLHNITPEEARDFDVTWQQHARGEVGGRGAQHQQQQLEAAGRETVGRPATRRRTPWT